MIRLDSIIKNEAGSGIGVVIYGIVIMLVLSLVSINILNAKVIQDGYDRLRDSVEAAAAGSVLHIALGNQEAYEGSTSLTGKSDYQVAYDPWLQLALGFIMESDSSDATIGNAIADEDTVATNDYIKFDHKKVVTHTMRVLQDGVLKGTGDITDSKYKIKMIFLEPAYDSKLNKSIDVVIYDNEESMYDSDLVPDDDFKGISAPAVGDDLISKVEEIINGRLSGVEINLQANAGLVEELQTRPYYFIVIEDFPLPTLFSGKDTSNGGIFAALGEIGGDGSVGPMFALQGSNAKRKVAEEDDGIK